MRQMMRVHKKDNEDLLKHNRVKNDGMLKAEKEVTEEDDIESL